MHAIVLMLATFIGCLLIIVVFLICLSCICIFIFIYFQAIKPVYQKLADENTEVAFGLVDVDENSDAALEFEINAVPTFVFFDGERAVEKMTGADTNQLEKLVGDLKSK